jgi:hypothetical protein
MAWKQQIYLKKVERNQGNLIVAIIIETIISLNCSRNIGIGSMRCCVFYIYIYIYTHTISHMIMRVAIV